jgi:hypothetical protein
MQFLEFQLLLNTEGNSLTLLENTDKDALKERLYVRGVISNDGGYIISKVNDTALKLFFDNKISLKELFLLRNDEPYILKKRNKPLLIKFFSDKELDVLMSQIHCGNHYFYSFSENERAISPSEALKKVNLYFINGLGAIESEGRIFIEH